MQQTLTKILCRFAKWREFEFRRAICRAAWCNFESWKGLDGRYARIVSFLFGDLCESL